MTYSDIETRHMRRALSLAARGQGLVEPNPMVGCVIAIGERVAGEGWHQAFGQAHAEVNALTDARSAIGQAASSVDASDLSQAVAFVTLEPCCHQGKTPPCTDALIASGIRQVVVAGQDPFSAVSGKGIEQLRQAGVEVRAGLLEEEAVALNAPYFKLLRSGLPWVIAKWAMTLDGKIASHSGESQWISSEPSRKIVHRLRARMDAVIVGSITAQCDDPQLTARPAGARTARRIVVDSRAALSLDSKLVRTAMETPTWIAVGPAADGVKLKQLEQAGVIVWQSAATDATDRFKGLLAELGRQRCSNVLVEGGGALLGSLFDHRLVDEVHAFVAPKILGGAQAVTAVQGRGFATVAQAAVVDNLEFERVGDDLYLHGRLA